MTIREEGLKGKTLVNSYKNRQTTKTKSYQNAYKLSCMYIGENKTKEEQIKQMTRVYDKEFKLKPNMSEEDLKELFCKNIISVGIFKDGYTKKNDESVKETNFLFIDIDNGCTIEEAQEILDKDSLSYVLFTSNSHTEEKHKFHIFIPTLKKVKGIEEYKAYYRYLDSLFSEKIDSKCSNWSRACFASPSNCIVINKLFRNDLNIKITLLKSYKRQPMKEEILSSKDIKEKSRLNENYINQIKSINSNLILESITDSVIRFKRDNDDKIGNVFNKYNQEKHLVDKTISMDLLFSNDEFNKAIDCKKEREAIQNEIKQEIELSLLDMQFNEDLALKKIIVANEGVGKSRAVINACKEHKIIFACQTKDRVNELEESFKKENIEYVKAISIEDILKSKGIKNSVIDIYKDSFINEFNKNKYEESKEITNILKSKGYNDTLVAEVINEIKTQNELLKIKDKIVLLTVQKLKYFLKTNPKIKTLPIVFDELEISDFYNYSARQLSNNQSPQKYMDFYNGYDLYFPNIFTMSGLLKYKQVILLTTEKAKIEPLFSKDENYEIIDFSKKMLTNNVEYLIVNSTSSKKLQLGEKIKKREKIISELKEEIKDIDCVIADNAKNSDKNHLLVRGSNDYKDKNILVVISRPTAIEEYIYYLSCREYFDEKYKNEKIKDRNKLIQKEIQKRFMESKVSQSIGRNSGFRESGKKCYVVLPILAPNSEFKFSIKDFELNFVSSKVKTRIFYFKSTSTRD